MVSMAELAKNVTISGELAKAIGPPADGTRIYRAEGTDEDYMRWWDALAESFPRGLVSPGGGSPYAGVSRAAIHRAMRDGRLTVFAFHKVKEQRGIFGSKLVRENPYLYLAVIELKAWRLELEERIGRHFAEGEAVAKVQEAIRRELEGERPDWTADFIVKHPQGRVIKKSKRGANATAKK